MQITVRLFAALREAVGQERITLVLDEGATVADAWAGLCARDAGFGACRTRLLIARNRRYVSVNEVLADGDELALFPPLSGG